MSDSFKDHGDHVIVTLDNGETVEGRALIGCDGMWSRSAKASSVTASRAYPVTSPTVPFSSAKMCPRISGARTSCCGPARTHFVHYPLRRGELYNLVAVFHSDHYEEGWNAEGSKRVLWQHFKMQRAASPAHARAYRDLAHVGAVRPRAGEELEQRPHHAARRCRASDAAISRARRLHGDRRRGCPGGQGGEPRRTTRRHSRPISRSAISAPRRTQIMARVYGEFYHARGVTAELRELALSPRTPEETYDSITWLYGGP